MQYSRLAVRQIRDVTVADLLDEHIDRLDPQAVDEISHALLALAPQGTSISLLVDFSRVHFMGSTLLGTLIRLSKRITENGGCLKICGLNPAIAKMFAMVKLDHILDIHTDQQSALDIYGATA